jgi:virginiamycin B lyase
MMELPSEQTNAIVEYLTTHFPVKPGPDAVVIPGDVRVSINEWLLPSLGSRPHDPLAAADGSVWWTGQWANVLGRLDPVTDVMQEYPLPPDSGPHGLVEDADGNVWFTGISQNYIGKLDPTTGEVTQYPVSEGSRGPHTPIFDQNGTLWFTLQSGMVGRLVPETGEMTIVASPISQSVRSYPYGIVVNSQGVPWYVDFRANRLGRVDPVTMEIMEYPLPNPDTRPRRIAVTPDDVLWYTDYARGYLGRFDPVTGEVQEWPSPGGTESRPYGITAVDNVVWYSESSVQPNTLVRFDTENESFQTWIIPSGGGIIRHMMATANGDLVLACSGVNRVALVEVEN